MRQKIVSRGAPNELLDVEKAATNIKKLKLKGCPITDGYNCQKTNTGLIYLDTSNRKVFLHFMYVCFASNIIRFSTTSNPGSAAAKCALKTLTAISG